MDISDILKLDADTLETEIRRHNQLYWADNAPEISDETYDALVERLRELRPDAAVLDELEAPSALASSGAKVVHDHPMLSLDKCYSEEELLKWFDRFDGGAVATHKIDGVAMSVRYGPDGRLALGATRGNGRVGEDITANARHIGGVPERVDVPGLEVRGEAYMPLSVFQSRFAEEFANPRNLTAGAIKQKDAENTARYGLRFFAYDAIGLDDIPSEWAKRDRLVALGFEPAPGARCTASDAQATFEALAAHRERNDFETDGIVFKVDDVALHTEMGMTAHHPRWAIAYKYQGESGFSTLRGVEWNVSRSGSVNPVAVIAPVSLSGVTVTRASLHNLAIMEALAGTALAIGENPDSALAPGAKVLVTRRGGVIPHIESIATPGQGGIVVPATCPSCGGATERRGDFLHAEHAAGCAQGIRALEHFVKVVDIQGFGPKILAQLAERGWVASPADLYTLTEDQLADLDRLGRKSAANLIEAVDSHRAVPLWTLLAALGIPDLGGQVARFIEAAFRDGPPDVLVASGTSPKQDGADAGAESDPASAPDGEAVQGSLFGDALSAAPPAGTGRDCERAAPDASLPDASQPDAPVPDAADPEVEQVYVPAAPRVTREDGAYDPLATIRGARAEAFESIAGIGPIVSEKVVSGLESHAALLDALLEHVTVELEAPAPEPTGDSPLSGKSFVFTGAMERMSRSEAQAAVKSAGGSTPSGVSAKLDFLVLGDKDFERFEAGWRSSKLKKAEAAIAAGAGLRIISESEFVAWVEG